MTDLRTAAQQALEILERLHGGCTDSDDGTVEAITIWCPEIIDALRAALAEPVQEPVAFKDAPERIWLQMCEDEHCEVPFREHADITWAAEQQNPLDVPYVRADFAASPQRKPLTDEEIQDCWQQRHRDKATERRLITRAIERAHGIGGTNESA